MAEHVTFGGMLRRYRLAANLTQEALAERAGLSARAIRALESGERSAPYRDTLERLVQALGLDGTQERVFRSLAAPVPRQRQSAVLDQQVGWTDRRLPIPPTSFVGRQQEIATVTATLGAARLVTLTGPGGVGKTRLALQIAADLHS